MEESHVSDEIDWDKLEADVSDRPDLPEGVTYRRREMTQEMLRKSVLWDVAPHSLVPDVSMYLGLPFASDDGLSKEHDDAHTRLGDMMLLVPPTHLLTKEISRAIVGTMLVMDEGPNQHVHPVDSEGFNDAVAQMEQVTFKAALSVVGHLIDFGLLHTPHLISMEEMDEMMGDDEDDTEEGATE